MKKQVNIGAQSGIQADKVANKAFEGYPLYPASDDIYSKFKNENDIDPENLTMHKSPNEMVETSNEKDFMDDVSGADLDIPGSELDDNQEDIGGEDEENNFYSIGGDGHNDLDEDNG